MSERTRLTTVETVRENRSWLFTVRDRYGEADEVILVPCDDPDERSSSNRQTQSDDAGGVEAWVNRCTHEAQRLDRGTGAAMRDGEIICPKHGSMFDACSGDCDNGDAAGTTLVSVDVTVENGVVYLTDDHRTFADEGGVEDDEDDDEDGGPSSTSHLSL